MKFLKTLRLLKDKKQQDVANAAGITAAYYSMIETGELKLIDIDIYPRNPEYFSNRVLDGIIGLRFLIILILIIHYI